MAQQRNSIWQPSIARTLPVLLALGLVASCSTTDRADALFTKMSPPIGSTAVDPLTEPYIELVDAASWSIDAQTLPLLLFDVTAGAHHRLGGKIEVDGQRATFKPTEPLAKDHDFELSLAKVGVCGGDCGTDVTERDASEWPAEKISWPFVLRFSTRSRPAVRAVYLDESSQIHVAFSQPMDPVTTSPQFSLLDQQSKPVELGPAVWLGTDNRTARLQISATLEAVDLYTLIVERQAQGADGVRLDGNGNGEPGEIDDDFSVRFTGSQSVVLSRTGSAAP